MAQSAALFASSCTHYGLDSGLDLHVSILCVTHRTHLPAIISSVLKAVQY